MAAEQGIKISTSILNYFKTEMDFDNESEEFCEQKEIEFKEKLTEALNCGPATMIIHWVK